ncbi:hypothetical protein [Blastococcus sp. CT_GayMR16]|uniref:hypothetical protein n=1 Tax=Blastococcus sp. CT_GayMR16 TaxID=2559607 RepID=UPI0010734E19|nr:hypothetical protein [Blastococcus sp. CT_GayMR16]TFV89130.1 hypothetical protein E4P38_08265 [Blastococcus sp. CT_GayMR16]
MPRRRPGPRSGSGSRSSDREPARRSEQVEQAADGDWVVRAITGAATGKTYRCPGCDQEIRPGTPHVVTWPAYPRDSDLDPWDTESSADWRRHWHTACWRSRSNRR